MPVVVAAAPAAAGRWDLMLTYALERCPVCGSGRAADEVLGDTAVLQRCAECALVYAPEYADPSEIYIEGYLTGGGRFGIDTSAPAFQQYLAGATAERARLVTAAVGRPGRLLDVGCGSGEFLEQARRQGWDVQGVEPEEGAAEVARARGVPVVTGLVQDSGLPEHAFDVVAANHVLEHMVDPIDFLRLLSRWVRPGGHLALECPNFDSDQRRRRGGAWPHLRPLEHVVHFTPETLRDVLVRAGLEPVQVVTPTYLAPPQTVAQALGDLCREERAPYLRRLPQRVGWWGCQVLERRQRRRGAGAVVVAVARVD
ncbi:MAG: class I SAM-dependent methyltransferase [Actinomycetes bacterium]